MNSSVFVCNPESADKFEEILFSEGLCVRNVSDSNERTHQSSVRKFLISDGQQCLTVVIAPTPEFEATQQPAYNSMRVVIINRHGWISRLKGTANFELGLRVDAVLRVAGGYKKWA